MRFQDTKVLTRVLILIVFSNIIIAGALSFFAINNISRQGKGEIQSFKIESKSLIESKLKHLTETTQSIVAYYHAKSEKGELKKEDAQRLAAEEIATIRYDEGRGYFWINDMVYPYPKMIMHPITPALNDKIMDDPKYNCAMGKDQNLFQAFVEVCSQRGEGFVDYKWPDPRDTTKILPKLSFVTLFKPWNWVIGTGVYIDDIDRIVTEKKAIVQGNINRIISKTLILTITLCLIFFIDTFFFLKWFKNRLGMIKNFLENMKGDFTKRLDVDAKDEVGEIAQWLNSFIDELQVMIKEIADSTITLSKSSTDLSATSTQIASYTEQMKEKSTSVAAAAEEMSNNMVSVSDGAQKMNAYMVKAAEKSEHMATTMKSVSQTTEDSKKSVESIATATEEMTATVSEIAQNAEKARTITEDAVKSVTSASGKVDELKGAAKEINTIIEDIVEIAEQTKLLALNATIEAARAGEAGKGFAVVANEVKELAKQTNDATSDIRSKVEAIQNSTNSTISEITNISNVINKVNNIVVTIATSVEEQSVATKDIANNIGLTATGIRNMADNMKDTFVEVQEMTESVRETSVQIKDVSAIVNQAAEASS
ncbi:MAG: methyl-accepting chemotaxis protein, partial [bacterium]